MKNIKRQQALQRARVERANRAIKHARLVKHINDTRETRTDRRYKVYVKKQNETRERPIANTDGDWKPTKLRATTRTNWAREHDLPPDYWLDSYIPVTATGESWQTVIIYDGHKAQAYNARVITDEGAGVTLKIRGRSRTVEIYASRYLFADPSTQVEFYGGVVALTDIMELALRKRVELFRAFWRV